MLSSFISLEIFLILMGIMLVVIYKILTGKINTNGLLFDKNNTENQQISPGRIQLLLFTFMGALFYFMQVMANPDILPEIPSEYLYILFGSNAIYLGGKSTSLLPFFTRTQSETNNTLEVT